MITFYPGPSKLDERLPAWFEEGLASGIISANHRSEAFMQQYQDLQDLFVETFDLPPHYALYFFSSATECWEVIGQSFTSKSFSHVYNGAFGKKWAETNKNLGIKTHESFYDAALNPPFEHVEADIICLTHNETSNGSKLPDDYIQQLRQLNKNAIIAIDATSSMAGVKLPWIEGDIWFASVQKCFGLPAGMAVMMCDPKVLEHASPKSYYNDLHNVHNQYLNWQTTHTPNTLNIYFLLRLLQAHKGMDYVDEKSRLRAKELYDFFEKQNAMQLAIKSDQLQSDTVICVEMEESKLESLMAFCDAHGLVLGQGYGDKKSTSFRIANFPAIKREEINTLKSLINQWQTT